MTSNWTVLFLISNIWALRFVCYSVLIIYSILIFRFRKVSWLTSSLCGLSDSPFSMPGLFHLSALLFRLITLQGLQLISPRKHRIAAGIRFIAPRYGLTDTSYPIYGIHELLAPLSSGWQLFYMDSLAHHIPCMGSLTYQLLYIDQIAFKLSGI